MRESERWAKMIAALTSERDEAVREATEANERAAAADWLHGALLRDVDCTETSGLADEFLRRMMRIDNGETPNIEAVRVAGELRAKAALADEAAKTLLPFMQTTIHYGRAKDWLARYASLTASTGGSSDEPQKEIRE